jgi:predicted alpha/beta-hydrolase family hydrolase
VVTDTPAVQPILLTGPANGPYLVLVHGVGAGMDTRFMTTLAELLAARGVAVARFEFAYMAARRYGGKGRRRPPIPQLEDEYRSFLAHFPYPVAAIGGKSLGAWVASFIVDDLCERLKPLGLVGLGYPFHPGRQPQKLLGPHLKTIRSPTLIVQGECDPHGSRPEVEALSLSPQVSLFWLADGDHSFEPRKGSGTSLAGNMAKAADAVARFMSGLNRRSGSAPRRPARSRR